jgi:membrane-associated protein
MLETIQHFGYLGIFLTIFLEIGLMIFPLPGDTLLFTTGIISMSGALDYKTLILVSVFASFLSGHLGYFIGTKINRNNLLNNRIYKVKEHQLSKTEKFFEKYGVFAILFSRFVPIVRNLRYSRQISPPTSVIPSKVTTTKAVFLFALESPFITE